MDANKWAVVIDQNVLKGQQVEKLLRTYYSSLDRPVGDSLRDVLGFVDMNNKSIDILVVAGDYGKLGDLLDMHRKYRLPTIIRVDEGPMTMRSDLYAKTVNGYYRTVVIEGIPKDIRLHIDVAQRKAATFKK